MTETKNINISWEEQVEKLNEKLKKCPPTKVQNDYYEYSKRYKGYEFVHVITGIVLTKFELWTKSNGNIKKISVWLDARNHQYTKRLKVDWVLNNKGEAIRVKFPRKR